MKKLITLIISFVFVSSAYPQLMWELIFTANFEGSHIPLESVLVENLTQGGDTTLYYPDTVLLLLSTGINEELRNGGFQVIRAYPNPFQGKSQVDLYIPERGEVFCKVSNITGQVILEKTFDCLKGFTTLSFVGGAEQYYLLGFYYENSYQAIKLLGEGGKVNIDLVHHGLRGSIPVGSKRTSTGGGFEFEEGDELRYTAQANYFGEDIIIDIPDGTEVYEFEFEMGVPCPGIPTITYEGQVYNTVQIGGQCWLKENLNVGVMIDSSLEQTNNATIEKYCYNNETLMCDKYGGLYQWDEAMGFTTTPGTQGICPEGWHIPTLNEWKILEGIVDSVYGVGHPEWDTLGWRGTDAGGNLKENSMEYWQLPNTGATNKSGFTALPAGFWWDAEGIFDDMERWAMFWSSYSDEPTPYAHGFKLTYTSAQVYNTFFGKINGFSVRCIKD